MTISSAAIRAIARDAYNSPVARFLRSPFARMLGPAFAVSIGYIDPGNWATDLGAGAFGYRLLWVVLLANAIALVLQLAVSELTIGTGEEFGALVAQRWPRLTFPAWLLFQGAAIATDLAEFSGIVLGLQLLFAWPIAVSVVAGLFIVASLLLLTGQRAKGVEYAMIAALCAIFACCLYQLLLLHPAWPAALHGAFVPAIPGHGASIIVVGIIGATVMPHNLFLHSALVKRSVPLHDEPARQTYRNLFSGETIVALNAAAVVNGALLMIGAAVMGADGSFERALAMLRHVSNGVAYAFGAGLLLSGIAASITATVSGDFIFRALSPLRVPTILRRAVTILPAAGAILAGVSIANLLIWSQVILALILPFALVPLIILLRGRGRTLVFVTAAASALCVAFDVVMIAQTFGA